MAKHAGESKRSHEYELGHTARELRRLNTQAQLVDPMTRQFFTSAGIVAGMRVLDIGSGAGDVAFLAAELVGPSGEVVGTDRSPEAVKAAMAGAKARSLSNVSFRLGDPTALAFERPFDVIVGRYVLMFSPDPAAMLKAVASNLRPGGIIVFHESDFSAIGVQRQPRSHTYDRCYAWILETFRKIGTNTQSGLGLYAAFVAAGLPPPTMALQALVGGGSSSQNGVDLVADLAITMAPVMEQMGVATAKDLDAATLHARMHAEVSANGSVLVGRYEVGAWSRVP
jgi:ubiquinone/menaquinone biosynthesis C-methylase UbiE